jgi:hypothetical protein
MYLLFLPLGFTMGHTITIKLRNKKARTILESLEELKVIEILHDEGKIKWTPRKKKQAKDFLLAYKQAKLAEQGKIKLKTLDELINEL